MSGFDKDWLELREPADHAARSRTVLETLKQYFRSQAQPITIMDIGCGTGSTYRAVSPVWSEARWKLLDYETELLDEARHRIGGGKNVTFHCQDLNELDETLLEDATIVTASALFDLCSMDFCDKFVKTLAECKLALYAALNYDGVMEWTVNHPMDDQVVADFNLHQRSDKGFGPALGPGASDHLSTLCKSLGFLVETASSPWRLGFDSGELQREFLQGLRNPVLEIGNIDPLAFNEWLDFRVSHISVEGSVCTVGHTDVLALPLR